MKRKTLSRRKPKRPPKGARTLGDNIKRIRTSKGLSQRALGHASGYTGDNAGAAISRFESDRQAPRIDTLSRIADALGVAVCALLVQNS